MDSYGKLQVNETKLINVVPLLFEYTNMAGVCQRDGGMSG